MGSRAVPILAVALDAPSPGRLENVRRKLSESYQPQLGLSADDYSSLMFDAYVARRQTRAAVSLADIRTSDARVALSRALAEAESRAYRTDVVRAIAGALSRATNQPFTGTVNPTSVNFGDTVRVRAGNLQWTPTTSVILHGSPFGAQVFQQRFNTLANTAVDDSLKFVAVGELGTYVLSVTAQGPNAVTQVDTSLRIRSMRYDVHTTVTAEIIPQGELPQTRYLVLGSRGDADTLDFFKVATVTAATITATARWPGAGDVQLGWRSCSGGFPGGTTVAGLVLSGTGAAIGGAMVSVVGTAVGTATSPTGAFNFGALPLGSVTGGLVTLQVRRIGYGARTFRVPAGSTGNVLSLTSAGATVATSISMRSATAALGAGDCRLLQVWTSPTGRHRIIQLRIAS